MKFLNIWRKVKNNRFPVIDKLRLISNCEHIHSDAGTILSANLDRCHNHQPQLYIPRRTLQDHSHTWLYQLIQTTMAFEVTRNLLNHIKKKNICNILKIRSLMSISLKLFQRPLSKSINNI